MPTPIVIHVLRPYASEEEYLAHEGFSISPKTMLLLDQPPLPVDATIVFDVALSNGQKPIRAEGIVLGYAGPSDGQPGGIRVRFKRYGAATKAFIDRASASPAASMPPQPAVLEPPIVQHEPTPNAEPLQVEPAGREREPTESSGVHRKVVLPVQPPINREALLASLRARRAG